jgi:hypothetical protein
MQTTMANCLLTGLQTHKNDACKCYKLHDRVRMGCENTIFKILTTL